MESATEDGFRRIGQGFCGIVWARKSKNDFAIKREDGGPGRSLRNDYFMHRKALDSLNVSQSSVCIACCYEYVEQNDLVWWEAQISKFPKHFQERCNALPTGRIPPFPQSVRETLIDIYCAESLRPSINSSEPDRDCLIRPYLGRRRRLERKSRFQAFSLCNYPLHADQIEELGLNGTIYARIMAETLVILYWRAQIDANDVEFVLAPLREDCMVSSGGYSASPTLSNRIRWANTLSGS